MGSSLLLSSHLSFFSLLYLTFSLFSFHLLSSDSPSFLSFALSGRESITENRDKEGESSVTVSSSIQVSQSKLKVVTTGCGVCNMKCKAGEGNVSNSLRV